MTAPLPLPSHRWCAGALLALAAAITLGAGPAVAQAPDSAVVVSSAEPALPDPPETVMSLEEAIERALAVSPTMAQATAGVRSAEAGRRSAYGAYLPSVNASSGASRSSSNRFNPQTNTTVTGSSNSYNAGLNAGVDIWNGGRRGAEIDNASAAARSSCASPGRASGARRNPSPRRIAGCRSARRRVRTCSGRASS